MTSGALARVDRAARSAEVLREEHFAAKRFADSLDTLAGLYAMAGPDGCGGVPPERIKEAEEAVEQARAETVACARAVTALPPPQEGTVIIVTDKKREAEVVVDKEEPKKKARVFTEPLTKETIFTELQTMGFAKSSAKPEFKGFAKRNSGETVYALQVIDHAILLKEGRRSALDAYRRAKAEDRAKVEVKPEGDCLSKGNDDDFVEHGFATSKTLRLLFTFF